MTTYNAILHTTTTHDAALAGFGILCNNTDILCNSEDYYCDGSVVMRDICPDSVTYNNISYIELNSLDQDYLEFNETDVPGKLTVAQNTITLTDGDRDEDYYVTKDFGADYLGDFTHWVDVNVTALTDSGPTGFACWALSNVDDDLKDIDDAGGDALFLWTMRNTATSYKFILYSIDGGVLTNLDASSGITVGTKVFVSVSRAGTTLTAEIYSAVSLRALGGAGDVDTITGTGVGTAFRYLYGIGSYNNGGTGYDISGTVKNLSLRS